MSFGASLLTPFLQNFKTDAQLYIPVYAQLEIPVDNQDV